MYTKAGLVETGRDQSKQWASHEHCYSYGFTDIDRLCCWLFSILSQTPRSSILTVLHDSISYTHIHKLKVQQETMDMDMNGYQKHINLFLYIAVI